MGTPRNATEALAIELLEDLGVLREITGKQRGRAYAYHEYLEALVGDDG